jgi:ABC-type multidrug transport system ATPase subunit
VVEAEGVRKAYGEKLLFDDLSFDLPRGGIVGVIGPNGAGKTTVPNMITGQEHARRRHARSARPWRWPTSTRAATTSRREDRVGKHLGRRRGTWTWAA